MTQRGTSGGTPGPAAAVQCSVFGNKRNRKRVRVALKEKWGRFAFARALEKRLQKHPIISV
jgi:hypothetical protein